ncbi:unannotated protein [freshwater metagenome]|uniref:Unannotated protein n=1 Tax=freshwater metagenome TaxID=449393 RepID=A0A6J6TN94_9ZZZZ
MDLCEAGVGESRTLLMRTPSGRHVASLGVGRQEVHVAVTACCQHHSVCRMSADLAGEQVAGRNANGASVVNYDVLHIHAVIQGDGTQLNLPS